MVVRGATYERRPLDLYSTPPEATRVLLDRVKFGPWVCDPADGEGALLEVVRLYGYGVHGDDLARGYDFLKDDWRWGGHDIVTNPPYGPGGKTAVAFVERALELTTQRVAMLLPVDFDCGSTRQEIFGLCPSFVKKIILTNRIRWFNNQSGSTNHAWFIWDLAGAKPTVLEYAAQRF